MRYLTYYTPENNRIDIYNTWFGRETIFHNGNLVSEKHSWFGHCHEFSVTEGLNLVQYKIDVGYRAHFRIGFDIFRNGRAIMLS
jgi:hypothetical protein